MTDGYDPAKDARDSYDVAIAALRERVVEAAQDAPTFTIILTAVQWKGGDPLPGMYQRTIDGEQRWVIDTPHGWNCVWPGDWIITSPNGCRWPNSPEALERFYGTEAAA